MIKLEREERFGFFHVLLAMVIALVVASTWHFTGWSKSPFMLDLLMDFVAGLLVFSLGIEWSK